MNKKIKDNPTYKTFEDKINGIEILNNLMPFLNASNLKDFEGIKKSFYETMDKADRFNELFSSKGWVAHESMSDVLLTQCIELAIEDKIDQAEEHLSNYYSSKDINWCINQFKRIEAFEKRFAFIKLAFDETLDQKYYTVVPILLMIIDGCVNDITRSKGFFTDTTDLTAWDSIAGHSSGIGVLRDIFNKGRNSTNEEEIVFPYRNGILHGRDLNYANKYVVAKSWLTLIAVFDWAKSLEKIENTQNEECSIEELKLAFKEYEKSQINKKYTECLIAQYKPRIFDTLYSFPFIPNNQNLDIETPEYTSYSFITNWKNKNYGAISKQIHYFSKDIKLGKEAGRIRTIFEDKEVIEYKILSIVDESPAISEVKYAIKVSYKDELYDMEIVIRLIYQDESGNVLVRGENNGQWKFIESFFFYKISNIEIL